MSALHITTQPPSHHRRPLRRAAAILVGGLLVVLVPTACGSSPAKPEATADNPDLAPAPTGPCDEHHQEQAVAAATAAARKALGNVQLSDPSAHFLSIIAHPQMPGHPAEPPTYGWNVTFTAAAAAASETPSATRPPAEALNSALPAAPKPSTLAPPTGPIIGEPGPTAVGTPRPPTPPPAAAPPPPGAKPPAATPAPPRPAPDLKRPRSISVFVAVDGTARLF